MENERLIIVGGVAAGTKAAATARRKNPAANILLLQDEADVSYSACGLPYHLAAMNDIPRSKLIARTPAVFRSDGIDLRIRHRVEEIDAKLGLVTIRDLQEARSFTESYDKLLIATGAFASPIKASVSATAPPVVYLRSIADADHISQTLTGIRNLVILGGGYIGLEMAETFTRLGHEVSIVEMMSHVVPSFDEAIAKLVEAELLKNSVKIFTGSRVVELDAGLVILENGARIQADMVLVATGVRPSTMLATSAGIKLGKTGAIAVTSQMMTNIKNVYAAGDCAESRHVLSKQSVWMPLGDVANRHGRVAGINMAGGDAEFPGILGTAIFKVFDLAVARTGLGHIDAANAGFIPVTQMVQAPSRARYMSKSKTLQIHLTADRVSGRLLGCEIAGEDGVDKTIDIVAAAIWGKLKASDLPDLDLAYAPPFSPVLAPLQVAGEVLNKVIAESRHEMSMFMLRGMM
jgi:NADPH-dependent 2,4-dienoyl-CoA reductase/sulfur reductase-like enzyme